MTTTQKLGDRHYEVHTNEPDQSFTVTIHMSKELADKIRSREQKRIEGLNPGRDDIDVHYGSAFESALWRAAGRY